MVDPMVLFDELDAVIRKYSNQFPDVAILQALVASVASIITEDTELQDGRLRYFLKALDEILVFASERREELENHTRTTN